MHRTTLALLSMFGFVLAAVAAAPSASAQDAGSLIIGVSTCPQGYEGEDFAADCATPAEGVDFAIGTPNTGNVETTTSRADGLATFSLAPFDLDPTGPDTVTVGEPAAQALDYAVFCSDATAGEPLDFAYETIDFQPGGPLLGIRFDFETGASRLGLTLSERRVEVLGGRAAPFFVIGSRLSIPAVEEYGLRSEPSFARGEICGSFAGRVSPTWRERRTSCQIGSNCL